MFKIFLFVIMVLSVATSGVVYYSQALYKSSMIMQDSLIAQSMVNRLKSEIVFHNGIYYAPLGVNDGGYHQLPTRFNGVRTTSTGVPFVYCPYGFGSDGADDFTIENGDEEYEVTYSGLFSSTGFQFVASSTQPSVAETLAIVIVPRNMQKIPLCSDLSVDQKSNYVLSGDSKGLGRVYVISNSDMVYGQKEFKPFYIKQDGTSDTLSSALNYASENPSENVSIVLESGGTYSISDDFNIDSLQQTVGRYISIKSDNPSTGSSITGDSLIAIKGGTFNTDGVNFQSPIEISLDNVKSKIRNTSVNKLNITDSTGYFSNVTVGSTSLSDVPMSISSSIIEQQGYIEILGAGSSLVNLLDSSWDARDHGLSFVSAGNPNVFQLSRSDFVKRGGSMSFSGSDKSDSLIYVDSSSSVTLNNVTLSSELSSVYAIYNMGVFVANNTALVPTSMLDVYVYTDQSSSTHFGTVQMGVSGGVRAQFAVSDNFSRSITGSAVVYAVTCKSGGHFDELYEVEVVDDFAASVNPDLSPVITQSSDLIGIDVSQYFTPAEIICL